MGEQVFANDTLEVTVEMGTSVRKDNRAGSGSGRGRVSGGDFLPGTHSSLAGRDPRTSDGHTLIASSTSLDEFPLIKRKAPLLLEHGLLEQEQCINRVTESGARVLIVGVVLMLCVVKPRGSAVGSSVEMLPQSSPDRVVVVVSSVVGGLS